MLEHRIFTLRDLTVTLGSGQPYHGTGPPSSGLVGLEGSLPAASLTASHLSSLPPAIQLVPNGQTGVQPGGKLEN